MLDSHKAAITIEIDTAALTTYSDTFLATAWHVAQANPADMFASEKPGKLVERVGWEIIRRWLGTVPPEMYHHQGNHYYWHQLVKFAKYQPGSPEWDAGEWVLKGTADDVTQPAGSEVSE